MKVTLRFSIFTLVLGFFLADLSEAQFYPHNDSTYTFVSTTNAFGRIQSYDGEEGRYEDVTDKMIDRLYQLVGLNSNYVWNPNDDPDINILDTLYYEGPDSLEYFRELIMDNSWRLNPPIDIHVNTLVRMFKDEHFGLARFGVTNVESTAKDFVLSVLFRARIHNVFGSETLEFDPATGRLYIFNSNGAIGMTALDRVPTGVSLIDFSEYDSTDPIRDNARDPFRWAEITKTTFDTMVNVGDDGGWAFMNFGQVEELEPGEQAHVWIAFTHGTDLDMVDLRLDAAIAKFEDLDTGVSVGKDDEMPSGIHLHQNYPNPFNPTTTVSFNIPEAAHVNLTVYNVIGQRVATLVDGTRAGGTHSVTFDASRLNSGMYIYRLNVNGAIQSRTMLLVK